jgi:uncharacterized repeat protein (TIGR01451 family)
VLVRGAIIVILLAGPAPGAPAHAAPDGTADVALTAAAGGPAVPGEPLTWTVGATNHGPSVAEGVSVTQTVPVASGEEIVSAISTVGSCSVHQPATVTCDLGTLDVGATAKITVGQTLAADRTGAPSTSAIVTAATSDPGTADNSATASATPRPVGDLWLTGGVTGPDTVLGGPPTVSLLLTDNGPGVLPAGTRATVTLPAPVNFAAAGSSSGCTASGRVVTCVLGKPLGVGSRNAVALTVRGTTAPAGSLDYGVVAEVPAGITDPDPANNRASMTNPGTGDADVGVTASGPTDAVAAGTTASVTYTVTNRGPADATGVSVTATLPDRIRLDSSATGCTAAGQTLTCPTIPALAVGAAVALVVTLAVDPTRPPGTVLCPVRVAVAGPRDPNDANRVGYAPVAVVRRASLALNASRTERPLKAGDPVTYELTVHNFGPGTATGVIVTDRLPVEVTQGTATVPAGTCAVAGHLHTCTLSQPLAADATVVVTITGTVSPAVAGDTITDAGFVSAAEPDPDSTDNGASSTGVVEGALTPAGNRVSGESPVHRMVARLTWWMWAGAGTVLVGLVLLVIALRRNAAHQDR